MSRRKVDPRCTQALRVMRNLMSQGWHEESLLVDAATAAMWYFDDAPAKD